MTVDAVPTLRSALGFHVDRLAVLFRRRLVHALAAWEMTPEQWQILVSLMESSAGEISQNDIARVTAKDRHNISRTLDRMERDGWIARKPHPADTRSHSLHATAKARREFPRVRATLVADFAPVLGRMEASRRELLLSLVQELTEILEEEG